MKNIAIYGAGGLGKEIAWLIYKINEIESVRPFFLVFFAPDSSLRRTCSKDNPVAISVLQRMILVVRPLFELAGALLLCIILISPFFSSHNVILLIITIDYTNIEQKLQCPAGESAGENYLHIFSYCVIIRAFTSTDTLPI